MSSGPSRAFAEPRVELSVPLPVWVRQAAGPARREWALNLSAGGLGLHSASAFAGGETVEVELVLPAEPPEAPPLRGTTRVAWVDEPPPGARLREVGLRWEGLGGPERERLRRALESLRAG